MGVGRDGGVVRAVNAELAAADVDSVKTGVFGVFGRFRLSCLVAAL